MKDVEKILQQVEEEQRKKIEKQFKRNSIWKSET